jgi:hypothetical protein
MIDLEKDYKNFIKDINIKDTKQNKQYFKNLVLKTYISYWGINHTKTKEIEKALQEF